LKKIEAIVLGHDPFSFPKPQRQNIIRPDRMELTPIEGERGREERERERMPQTRQFNYYLTN